MISTIVGVIFILFGAAFGLSRTLSWYAWTVRGLWPNYTRGGTALGVIRWFMLEVFFGVFWGGSIYLGLYLVDWL